MSNKIKTKYGLASLWGDYYILHNNGDRKKLHRVVYEDYHKCTLLPSTVVHHIDGNKKNNDISNLKIMLPSEHAKLHNEKLRYDFSLNTSTTGIYRVYKQNKKDTQQGFVWCYRYYDNNKRKQIRRIDLVELEKVVKSKGYEWKIVNDDFYQKSLKENVYNKIHRNINIVKNGKDKKNRQIYSLRKNLKTIYTSVDYNLLKKKRDKLIEEELSSCLYS